MKCLLLAALVSVLATQAWAHAGHAEAPGESGGAPTDVVVLADATIKNLGIETAPATLAPSGKTLSLTATVEYLPELYATVTPKANGTVSQIAVKLGDHVIKGQPLFTFMPTFVGSSPVTIASPVAGAVVKQKAVMGQPLTPETVVIEIADTRQVLVKGITYASGDFEQVKVGQKVEVVSGATSPLAGTVQRLDVGSDKENRTFAVYALVENPNGALFGNSTASLSVRLDDTGDVLTVPARAVLGDIGNYFLFVRDNASFERRVLTVGRKLGDRIEVIEGVLPDEQVVTVGNYQLQYAKTQTPGKAGGASGAKD